MPRLFIGVDVPALAPLCRLIDQLGRMGSSVRPVRPDKMHITFRFLDEVAEEQIEALSLAIDSGVQQAIREYGLTPFNLVLTHLGAFPSNPSGLPRVIFAEPGSGEQLVRLSDAIDHSIQQSGIDVARRDHTFHPHVTLARIRRRRRPDRRAVEGIARLLGDDYEGGLGSIRIKQVKLIESRPGSDGYDYIARHASSLKPSRG